MSKALMHLDGCHFYVWVAEDGRLTYDERRGENLAMHRSDEPCDRCTALSRGARPQHAERIIDVSDPDHRALVGRVFTAIIDIQEGTV